MSNPNRRDFLVALGGLGLNACTMPPEMARPGAAPKKVLIGAHPWVYAAKQPEHDIYPILDDILGDMAAAGLLAWNFTRAYAMLRNLNLAVWKGKPAEKG